MDSANNAVNVRISKRVLWVGSEAYPLQNIARAQAVRVIPKSRWTGRAQAGCLGFLAFLFVLGLGAAAHSAGGVLVVVVAIVAVAIVVALTRRKTQPYYALIIETSGNPRRALVSTDGAQVGNLVE